MPTEPVDLRPPLHSQTTPEYIIAASEAFPKELDTYSVVMYQGAKGINRDPHDLGDVRKSINGTWMIICNGLQISPYPMAIDEVVQWQGGTSIAESMSQTPIIYPHHSIEISDNALGAYLPSERSMHLLVSETDSPNEKHRVIGHELGHSLLADRFSVIVDDDFVHESFAKLCETFLSSALSSRRTVGTDPKQWEQSVNEYVDLITNYSDAIGKLHRHPVHGWLMHFLYKHHGLEKILSLQDSPSTTPTARMEQIFEDNIVTLAQKMRMWLFS